MIALKTFPGACALDVVDRFPDWPKPAADLGLRPGSRRAQRVPDGECRAFRPNQAS